MRHLYPAMIIAIATVACAPKRSTTTPVSNTSTAPVTNAAPSATATCCCDRIDSQSKFEAADACVADRGTCADDESNCHGIEEPIP